MSYLWSNHAALGLKKFKRKVREKIFDAQLQTLIQNARQYPSAELVIKINEGPKGLTDLFRISDSKKRRCFLKDCLNQFEDKINGEGKYKFCMDCGEELGKVISHRIEKCNFNDKCRERFMGSEWLERFRLAHGEEWKRRVVLKSLVGVRGKEIVNFFK